MKNKKVLVTGGLGFIGTHFLEYIFEKTNWNIKVFYRKNKDSPIKSDRIELIHQDLSNKISANVGKLDYIVHMASETSVDESLVDCIPFVKSNILGTANLLEWIKENHPKTKVCIFSSDEVMGPAPLGVDFKEDDQRKPSSPYSATKGGEELLAYSFAHSFEIPIFTVRCMNVYGERQDKRKFIPMTIQKLKRGEKIKLHGCNKNDVSSRHWVHAKDCADAVLFLLDKAKSGEIYHITGEERDVYYLSSVIYETLADDGIITKGNLDDFIEYVDFHSARPGHDKRYSLDGGKLKAMGWRAKYDLKTNIKGIIKNLLRE